MGIEDGTKIFNSVKRLKEDDSKSMSPEVVDYLHKKKVINEFEYKFYFDTIRKRILTAKQLKIRKSINQKLISFTSSEVNSMLSRINLVLKWAESNSHFNPDFVKSLKANCEKRGSLSEKQNTSLENIIKRFKIE